MTWINHLAADTARKSLRFQEVIKGYQNASNLVSVYKCLGFQEVINGYQNTSNLVNNEKLGYINSAPPNHHQMSFFTG